MSCEGQILIVSKKENFNAQLKSLLQYKNINNFNFTNSSVLARQKILENNIDILIVCMSQIDEINEDIAIDFCVEKKGSSLLFVEDNLYNDFLFSLKKYGVFVLPYSVSKETILYAFDWLYTSCEQMNSFGKKLNQVEDKIKEIRLINQAKWLLIGNLQLTETEAHHFIEKQAMDRKITKIQEAKEIIDMYAKKNTDR